jgi:hypothetical protein
MLVSFFYTPLWLFFIWVNTLISVVQGLALVAMPLAVNVHVQAAISPRLPFDATGLGPMV